MAWYWRENARSGMRRRPAGEIIRRPSVASLERPVRAKSSAAKAICAAREHHEARREITAGDGVAEGGIISCKVNEMSAMSASSSKAAKSCGVGGPAALLLSRIGGGGESRKSRPKPRSLEAWREQAGRVGASWQ